MAIVLIGFLLGICLVLAGGFSLLNAAFMRLSRDKLPAKLVIRQDEILSALVTGYLFFILSAVILMTHYLLAGLNSWQIGLHCLILTAFILPITHIFPRVFVLRQPEEFSIGLVSWIKPAAFVFHYPAQAVAFLGGQLLHLTKPTYKPKGHVFNTMEYYPLVSRYYESSATTDTIERKDYDIQKIMTQFVTLPVTEIMMRSSELKIMDVEMPVEELITAVFENSASRVLLYQDRAENIVGILHSSLLMKSFCLAEGDKNLTDITSAISEPVFISDDISVFDQLQDFSSRHEQFALIRNADNIIQGAVSMELILEKLFGQLKKQAN